MNRLKSLFLFFILSLIVSSQVFAARGVDYNGAGQAVTIADDATGLKVGTGQSIYLADGSTLVTGAGVITNPGALSCRSLAVGYGNVTMTAGNIIQTSGNHTLTAGNLNITTGNVNVTTGNVNVTTGNITGGQFLTYDGASYWPTITDVGALPRGSVAHFAAKLTGNTPFGTASQMEGLFANVQAMEGLTVTAKTLVGGELKATVSRWFEGASECWGVYGKAIVKGANAAVPMLKGVVSLIESDTSGVATAGVNFYADVSGGTNITTKTILSTGAQTWQKGIDLDNATITKSQITLSTGVEFLSGTATARASVRGLNGGAGDAAPIGSLYISTGGKIYQKVAHSEADNDWYLVTATNAD
jgi:hypothetical protein